MTTAQQIQEVLKVGATYYEGLHTEWTYIKPTAAGFVFRAQDGLTTTFEVNDIAMLASVKGSERCII